MGIKMLLLIIATSIWVYFDARSIKARSGFIKGVFNFEPSTWMLLCLLFWVFAFPFYLVQRKKRKEAAEAFYLREVMRLRGQ